VKAWRAEIDVGFAVVNPVSYLLVTVAAATTDDEIEDLEAFCEQEGIAARFVRGTEGT
jgi:hypothetical protein